MSDANAKTAAEKMVAAVKVFIDAKLGEIFGRLSHVEEALAVKAERGEKGDPGAPGEKGDPGVDGKDGAPGERGEKGDPGVDGKDGASGKDGAPGERGEKGDPGVDGKDGAPGLHGKDGAPGEKGDPGERGEKGDPGVGKDGRDGRDGVDGTPGRDALDLDILPEVDPAKKYPQGVFAAIDGGLFKSYRPTKPLKDSADLLEAGWSVVVRGIKSIDAALSEDGRTVTVNATTSDGVKNEYAFSVPTLQYRGVFTDGRVYFKGDAVTWGGSLFVAQQDTKEKPEMSNDWRLAVKRGRDGKDGGKK